MVKRDGGPPEAGVRMEKNASLAMSACQYRNILYISYRAHSLHFFANSGLRSFTVLAYAVKA